MAGQTLTLTIASQLQKAGFTEAAEHMRKLQVEIEGTAKQSSNLEGVMGKLKAAFTVTAAIAFYKAATEEAIKAEETNLRLKTNIENTGAAWDKIGERINLATESLAENSRFSNGEVKDALSALVQRTNDVAVAQANLKTVMGISIVTGRSMVDVASDLGAAANGNERALKTLSKEFGISSEKSKDAAEVLGILKQRFGDVAEKEDGLAKVTSQGKNAWNDLKEAVGNFMGAGPTKDITRFFTVLASELAKTFNALTELDKQISEKGFLNGIKAFVADVPGIQENLKSIPKALLKEMQDTSPLITDAAKAMSEQLKQVIVDMNNETRRLGAEQGATESIRLESQLAEFKRYTLEKNKNEIHSAQDRERLLNAIEARATAQRAELVRKQYEAQFKAAVSFGDAIGKATGKLILGEKDAWKNITDIVIDALVQQLQASIIAGQARAWITEVAGKGFLGLATGAVLSGLVAATGELAKAAIRGGSGSTSPSGGGGGGSFAGSLGAGPESATTPAAAPRQESNVRVQIFGDLYGEPTFVDRLAAKLSEAVENRDVRLVSTQVQ